MSLGIVVYFISSMISQLDFRKTQKAIVTVIEQGSMLLAMHFMYHNAEYAQQIIIGCFTIGLSIMLSGRSYTANINNSVCEYLGRISFVVYIIHSFVFRVIQNVFTERKLVEKFVISLFIIIVLTPVLYYFVENTRKKIKVPKLKLK